MVEMVELTPDKEEEEGVLEHLVVMALIQIQMEDREMEEMVCQV